MSFGEWIIWSETDDTKFQVGITTGAQWVLKAYNMQTNEYIVIDKEDEKLPKQRSCSAIFIRLIW